MEERSNNASSDFIGREEELGHLLQAYKLVCGVSSSSSSALPLLVDSSSEKKNKSSWKREQKAQARSLRQQFEQAREVAQAQRLEHEALQERMKSLREKKAAILHRRRSLSNDGIVLPPATTPSMETNIHNASSNGNHPESSNGNHPNGNGNPTNGNHENGNNNYQNGNSEDSDTNAPLGESSLTIETSSSSTPAPQLPPKRERDLPPPTPVDDDDDGDSSDDDDDDDDRPTLLPRRTPQQQQYDMFSSSSPSLGVSDNQNEEDCMAQMVLLSGHIGVGKTRLVQEFVRRAKESVQPCHFLYGKFEAPVQDDKEEETNDTAQEQQSTSFSALGQALDQFLTQLCNQQQDDDNDLKKERQRIRDGFLNATSGEGKRILLQLFPSLQLLLQDNDSDDKNGHVMDPLSSPNNNNNLLNSPKSPARNDNSWSRLVWAFKSLMRVLATRSRPLILCVDDLQYADTLSLDLLLGNNFLLNLKYVLLIGCYHSNQVMLLENDANNEPQRGGGASGQQVHLLVTKLDNLNDKIPFTELNLTPFDNTNGEDQEQPEENESHGDSANDDSQNNNNNQSQPPKPLLSRRPSALRRMDSSGLTDEEIEEIIDGIHTLSPQLRSILAIASFLRTTFPVPVIHRIMEKQQQLNGSDSNILSQDALIDLLDEAMDRGFLEHVVTLSSSTPSYRFSHGQIKQAVYADLVMDRQYQDDSAEDLVVQVGRALSELSHASEYGPDWTLFMAAELMNFEMRFGAVVSS